MSRHYEQTDFVGGRTICEPRTDAAGTVPGAADAVRRGVDPAGAADRGATWVIRGDGGRYLRCFFAGRPDWCGLRSNARRFDTGAAAQALDRCAAAGEPGEREAA